MKRFGLFHRMSLVVLMLCLLLPVTLWAADTPSKNWPGAIRPGVMVGDKDNPTDYFTDFFIPVAGSEKSVIFLNPHVRFDDKSSNEENFGLGYRGLLSGDKLILGVNAFFDTMHSEHNNQFSQIGFGVEALSQWVDFRANYYSPVGTRKHRVGDLDKYKFETWSLVLHEGYEEALSGFDAEVGVLIPGISDVIESRVFFGGYWYDSDIADDVNGWKGRIEIRPSKLISLNAEVRHDDFRGTNSFFGGYLDIPFSIENIGKGKSPFEGFSQAAAFGKGARTLPERMSQKVERDRHITTIATDSKNDTQTIVKDMIYVNQDNTGTQNGSLQHPWNKSHRRAGKRWSLERRFTRGTRSMGLCI